MTPNRRLTLQDVDRLRALCDAMAISGGAAARVREEIVNAEREREKETR